MSDSTQSVQNQLLDNAPCGYVQIDGAGKILKINTTLRRWMGYDHDEQVACRLFEDLFTMGGKMYCQTHLLPLLKIEGEFSEVNLTIAGSDAITFPALLNAKKDALASDTEQTFSVFIVDITQRKMYEQELLMARKSAEEAAQRLVQVNCDLEQFAYTASHDLQSPLRNISVMIDLLERKKIIEPDTEGARLFALIRSNSNQLSTMVQDLLEYSKISDNQADYGEVALEAVCKQAIAFLKAAIDQHQAVIEVAQLPVVAGSHSQLTRLFQNLIENSLKYRSEQTPHIVVSQRSTHAFHFIDVSDNGMGFSNEHATKIFSFMQRLHSNQSIPGTGIGLTACKRIMTNHGGTIHAASEPGKGAVFTLQFPI